MYAPLRSLVVAAAVVLGGPATLSAQQAVAADTPDSARASAAPVADGPRLEITSIAARSLEQPASANASLQRRNSVGRPVALMVVGGAAIILGSVIDDAPGTLFMIGGTVALLYGLYLWLQ